MKLCDECKKDWTKCALCPVMIQWRNENMKNEETEKPRTAESEVPDADCD